MEEATAHAAEGASTELHHTHPEETGGADHSGHSHGPSLNPELTREIEVEAPAEEVSKAFRTVVKRYQKLARIPGFRAGKVPETLVRAKFSREVRQEVMESLVAEKFRQAIDEQKLRPVSEPQLVELMLVDGAPLKFKASFEVLPHIDLAGYDTVSVERPNSELTDDDLEGEILRLLESHAVVEPVEEERSLADGDWAEIQFRGTVQPLAQTVRGDGLADDAPKPPIEGNDILIEIGGKQTLPAFNDALRGTKAGQELTFEVVYPADFGERSLAGQTVSYDVTVKAIKRKTYPERNEELAKQLGNYETWDDLVAQLRVRTQSRKREAMETNARNRMLDEVIGKFSFPVPESLVQQQVDARLERGLRALAHQGMTPEDMRKLDFDRLRIAQRAEAEREVRASLLLDRIAEAEQVSVADTEVDNEVLMLSIQTREPLEALRERLRQDGGLGRIREQMRREKAGTALYERLAS